VPSVDLSNPNLWSKKYLPSIITPNIYNILWGSAGSGKSQTMIQFFLMEVMDQSQNQEQTFFVIRKVAATLRNSVYQDFKNKISEWGLHSIVRTLDGYLEIRCGSNKIVFLGCDNPEKLKSLSQAKYIWIEEATELALEDFTQVTLRLRGHSKHIKRFFLTFNPVSDSHWIKKRFFDEPPQHEVNRIQRIHGTYLDALPFLDKEYPNRMEALKDVDETFYEVYAKGNWGVWDRESLFARNFKVDEHCQNYTVKAHPGLDLYLSFDFNVTNTCVIAQFSKNSVEAGYYAKINILKVYRVGDLEELCKSIMLDYPGMNYIINGDPAGNSRQAGTKNNISNFQLIQSVLGVRDINMQVLRFAPSHLATKLISDMCFKKCLFWISTPNCKELIADFKEAKVDRTVSLDPWKKKNPNMSHALDCFRYFIYGNFLEITSTYNLDKFDARKMQL
jgi:PBSX family phage terminase large subunit